MFELTVQVNLRLVFQLTSRWIAALLIYFFGR